MYWLRWEVFAHWAEDVKCGQPTEETPQWQPQHHEDHFVRQTPVGHTQQSQYDRIHVAGSGNTIGGKKPYSFP
ncbi:hypothetical protein HD806DRAFT_364309 [Xylariaceae sp. AK1471]|nr:hypothetical protein HD806DRAFT_364309 [Xylariaceae sp. AK1471]